MNRDEAIRAAKLTEQDITDISGAAGYGADVGVYLAAETAQKVCAEDVPRLLSEIAALRTGLTEQARLHRISVNAGADAMRQIKEQLAAMTAERDEWSRKHAEIFIEASGLHAEIERMSNQTIKQRKRADKWQRRAEAAEAERDAFKTELECAELRLMKDDRLGNGG